MILNSKCLNCYNVLVKLPAIGQKKSCPQVGILLISLFHLAFQILFILNQFKLVETCFVCDLITQILFGSYIIYDENDGMFLNSVVTC